MKKLLLTIMPTLFLVGCVSAETSLVYGTFEVEPDGPVSFCENYAEQTYYNVFNDLYDSRDSFGADSFARSQARRAADRAYERCLAGRTN